MYIPLMKPDIQEDDILNVLEVLKSGMLVQGKKVEQLENKVCEYLNVKNAIALASGTATLHLALVALGIGKGDEVILPSFSFVATANVIEIVGATPVFVDIDIDTFNIDVAKIENAITYKTKAIMPVHEFGLPCDIGVILKLAKKYGIAVIEDAACALGAKEKSKFVGTLGDLGSFSFHPRKAITSGEGGIITTNNNDLAKKIRALRNHGIEIQNNKIEFIVAGFNYRMTDIQAALLIPQLNRFEMILENKNEIAQHYLSKIKNSNIGLPKIENSKRHTWQTFHVLLKNNLDQEKVINYLKEMNIGVNYGAQCIPQTQFYKNKYNLNVEKDFPNSLKAFQKGLALPLYNLLSENEINYIINTVNNIK